jgi:hypothetical protein
MYTLENLVKYIHFPEGFYSSTPDYDMDDARPSELEELNEDLKKLKTLSDNFTGNFKGIEIKEGTPMSIDTRIEISNRYTKVYYDVLALNGDLGHLDDGDIIHCLHETHYDDDGDPREYASITKSWITDIELAIETGLNKGVEYIEESGDSEDIEELWLEFYYYKHRTR